MVFGKLYVQGGIDPTYLALTPQASGPIGFTNPLWVDNSGNLRSDQILINKLVTGQNATLGTGNLTINNSLGTGILAPLLTLNQTTTAGILYTEKYNQRTTASGTAIQESYYAKSGATKTEFTRVRLDTPTSTSGQYVISVNQAGVLTNYLTCNGLGGSVDMEASFLNMRSHPILGVTTITDYQALPFIPQVDVEANINIPTSITAYDQRHQLLLKSKPVANIDRFVQQVPFITGATIRCSAESASYQWVGTTAGDVYIYDAGLGNWLLVATFTGNAGTINALYYNSHKDRLYIGGSFVDCSGAVTNLNNVCYIQAPSTSSIAPTRMVWASQSDAGFNAQCNAITGESSADYIYFGGDFDYTFGNTIQLQRFGIYDGSTNVITPINGNSGDGFNGSVNNLDFLASGGYICATGDFTVLSVNSVGFTSNYCLTFTISGVNVGSVYILDGGSPTISNSIPGYDLIDNNGAEFFVGLGNQTYNGHNYLMKVANSAVSESVGANSFTSQINSFFYNQSAGYVEAVQSAGYFQNGSIYAVIPFSSFVFRFKVTGVTWFNNQGAGTQWAFTGSNTNTFTLSGGRILIYNGTTYTGGITNNSPINGSTCLINWNTVEYMFVGALPPNWTPF